MFTHPEHLTLASSSTLFLLDPSDPVLDLGFYIYYISVCDYKNK